MNDDGILGAALGQIGQTVKQGVKQVVKIPEEMARDAGGQVGSATQNPNDNKASENNSRWQSDEERVKFLRDLYGSSEPSAETSAFAKASADVNTMADKRADKPEEQKKLLELRNQLHKENYYDPTFNPVKNPPAGREERPAEKVEKEKKQEMVDLQKKEEEKPPPLAVVREQNKTEMFRGATG